jgi:hypothetical protein
VEYSVAVHTALLRALQLFSVKFCRNLDLPSKIIHILVIKNFPPRAVSVQDLSALRSEYFFLRIAAKSYHCPSALAAWAGRARSAARAWVTPLVSNSKIGQNDNAMLVDFQSKCGVIYV